ncbi:MAG: hypothetical protein JO270_25120 [Acidobacteriaceae bacterium]|nr:hypothetical protein [Acidobacteriaceae bacterium]MBV8569224.1 hypothetical protein [Acidobacteriaceae bacterium]
MEGNQIRLRINGLTELDRLELEKIIEPGTLEFQRKATPSGQLGEPGTWTAIIEITALAVPIIGSSLALWLSHGSRRSVLKDQIEIETDTARVRRKLLIKSSSSDALKAEVVKQLTDIAALATSNETAGQNQPK